MYLNHFFFVVRSERHLQSQNFIHTCRLHFRTSSQPSRSLISCFCFLRNLAICFLFPVSFFYPSTFPTLPLLQIACSKLSSLRQVNPVCFSSSFAFLLIESIESLWEVLRVRVHFSMINDLQVWYVT